MATKKNVASVTASSSADFVLDLDLQRKGLDLVKQLYLAGVSPTGPELAAYNSCARGLPTAADVDTVSALVSSLLA